MFIPYLLSIFMHLFNFGLCQIHKARDDQVCDNFRESIFLVKGPAADATDEPQPTGLLGNPVMKTISSFVFPSNGAPVE
jgi:hypothetical protein